MAAAFLLMYVGPLVGNVVLAGQVDSTYTMVPLSPAAVLIVVVSFALFLFFHRFVLSSVPHRPWPALRAAIDRVAAEYRRRRLAWAILVLALAVVFVASGLNTYRYSSTRISEGESGWIILVIAARAAVTLDLLYAMFFGPREAAPLRSRRGVENLLLAAALVVTADGTGSMLLALLVVGFALHPRLFWRISFSRASSPLAKRGLRLALAAALLVVVFLAASFAGEFIKVAAGRSSGVGEAVLGQFASGSDFAPAAMVARLSTYHYSFLYTLAHPWSELNEGFGTVLRIPLENAWFRFDFLTGGFLGAERPEVGSLSRWNYLQVSENPTNPREGSSPGVLAAFYYVFPVPLGIVLGALYLAWLARAGDVLVRARKDENLSLLGAFILLLFVMTPFQSPFDVLLLFDSALVFLAPLLVLYLARSGASREPGPAPLAAAEDAGEEATAVTGAGAPTPLAYIGGRLAGAAARPLILFAVNALLAASAAQGVAVAFLVTSLALLASAADTHRAYYARRFEGHSVGGDESFHVYAASLGLLALVGSLGVILVAWYVSGSAWLALACAAYFVSEKLPDEILRFRLFQGALHAWGRSVLARSVTQLLLLAAVLVAGGPGANAAVIVSALALGNLLVFVPQVPVVAWSRTAFSGHRPSALMLAGRAGRALAASRWYWVLGLLGASVAYLDRLTTLATVPEILPLFMLVVMCFSAVTMSVDYFFVSRHRRDFLQRRIEVGSLVANRRLQGCVAGGLVVGLAATAAVLALSPNGGTFPLPYVGAIAALQTLVAVSTIPREIGYWRQSAGRLVRVEAAFWAALVPMAAATWYLGGSLGHLLALLVGAAALRLLLLARLAKAPAASGPRAASAASASSLVAAEAALGQPALLTTDPLHPSERH